MGLNFGVCSYIFGNVEPQDYLALRNKAANATKAITGCIERNLGLVGTDPESEVTKEVKIMSGY